MLRKVFSCICVWFGWDIEVDISHTDTQDGK